MDLEPEAYVLLGTCVTTLGGLILALIERGKRKKAESETTQAETKAETAETIVSNNHSVSETALARVAEQALDVLQTSLDNEKEENANLNRLLEEARRENVDKSKTIQSLEIQVEQQKQRIRELEQELERLRGRLDAILKSNDREITGTFPIIRTDEKRDDRV